MHTRSVARRLVTRFGGHRGTARHSTRVWDSPRGQRFSAIVSRKRAPDRLDCTGALRPRSGVVDPTRDRINASTDTSATYLAGVRDMTTGPVTRLPMPRTPVFRRRSTRGGVGRVHGQTRGTRDAGANQ